MASGAPQGNLGKLFHFFLFCCHSYSTGHCLCHFFCLQYQGDEVLDTDIPTYVEAKLFCTTAGKFLWVILQPFFYALRPMFVYPKNPEPLEVINLAIQLTFDIGVYYFFGEYSNTYEIFCNCTIVFYSQ